MRDPLKEEFISSFASYVPAEGNDIRRQLLGDCLKVSPEKLIEQQMAEPYDLAAMMTVAVRVDPRTGLAQCLMAEYNAWQRSRELAEEAYEDADSIVFEPRVEDVPIRLDTSVPGLLEFFQTAPSVEGGKAYVAQILVCLMWARSIPEMIPNLWRPNKGQE